MHVSPPPPLCPLCVACAQAALAKLLLFNKLDPHVQRKVVQEMYERNVGAGEILIKEGDTGAAATELYVTKSGKFEVGQPVLSAFDHALPGAGQGEMISETRTGGLLPAVRSLDQASDH